GKKTEEASGETAPAEESTAAAEPAPNAPAAPAAPGNEVLPGASSVRAALERKDYETAVGGLLALRGAATQGPMAEEYTALYDEVKFALLEAAPTDPKAAKALAMFRAATAGR
ncbi:MAG: hypothetical protein ACXW32_07195, partial [Limisphaerales bacterium]